MSSIAEKVFMSMGSDDTDDSDRLMRLYDDADEKGKALIDDVLICLCGYSMPSLKDLEV
jgi:hypothetical protein